MCRNCMETRKPFVDAFDTSICLAPFDETAGPHIATVACVKKTTGLANHLRDAEHTFSTSDQTHQTPEPLTLAEGVSIAFR